MNNKPLLVIAGYGDGLGDSIARFFQAKGYRIIAISRTAKDTHNDVISYQADLSKEQDVKHATNEILAKHGTPDVIIHNLQQLLIADFAATSSEEFENCWRSMTLSAFLIAQAFLPGMKNRGSGTMLISGATASIRGSAKFAAFSSAKFALRGLTQSLARSYQQHGIHIAHVILDGIIDSEKSRKLHNLSTEQMMQTDDIAQLYWQLTQQPQSTWTHELDLRPANENF